MAVVYRGRHCPRCRKYLKTLDGLLDEFRAIGVDKLAVSGGPQERAREEVAEENWRVSRRLRAEPGRDARVGPLHLRVATGAGDGSAIPRARPLLRHRGDHQRQAPRSPPCCAPERQPPARRAFRGLGDARVAIDNNMAEGANRPIALGRKNFLSANSDAGGEILSDDMIVIGTAKLSGLNPESYLAGLLARIRQ